MKDKIIVAIVCAFFISMVWISSTSNTTISKDSVISEVDVSIPAEDKTMEFIDFDASERHQSYAIFHSCWSWSKHWSKLRNNEPPKNDQTLLGIQLEWLWWWFWLVITYLYCIKLRYIIKRIICAFTGFELTIFIHLPNWSFWWLIINTCFQRCKFV